MDNEIIVLDLREKRLARGLTQDALGDLVGHRGNHISRVERGGPKGIAMTLPLLLKLVEVLGPLKVRCGKKLFVVSPIGFEPSDEDVPEGTETGEALLDYMREAKESEQVAPQLIRAVRAYVADPDANRATLVATLRQTLCDPLRALRILKALLPRRYPEIADVITEAMSATSSFGYLGLEAPAYAHVAA